MCGMRTDKMLYITAVTLPPSYKRTSTATRILYITAATLPPSYKRTSTATRIHNQQSTIHNKSQSTINNIERNPIEQSKFHDIPRYCSRDLTLDTISPRITKRNVVDSTGRRFLTI